MPTTRNLSAFIRYILLSIAFGIASQPTCALERFEHTFPAMGVEFRIVGFANDKQQFDSAVKAVVLRVGEIEQRLSDYNSASEINQLSKMAPHQNPVAVSKDLWRICQRSRQIYELTDGAFDPTIGRLSSIWRMARKRNRIPDEEKIKIALKFVGLQNLKLSSSASVQIKTSGVKLDFGGIAKGYAADEAIAVLASHLITRALVDAAGDICVSNPPPGTNGWKIATAERSGTRNNTLNKSTCVVLSNQGIATSGDTVQRLVVNGKRYSHIIDPRTGYGVTSSQLVTVIADDAMSADAFASAFSVLESDRGIEIAERSESVFLAVQDSDGAKIRHSNGFRKFIVTDSIADPAARLSN